MFELGKTVSVTVNEILAADEDVTKEMVINAIIAKHPRPVGEDSDYWIGVEYMAVDALVRNFLHKRKCKEDKGETSESETLPGFEYLQQSYSVVRGGEQRIVKLQRLTDDELLAKEQHLETCAISNQGHAREIRKFRENRAN